MSESSSSSSSESYPNFFVAIPIVNTQILSTVKKVQTEMTNIRDLDWRGLRNTCLFRYAMVPRQRLHVTLNACHLADDDEILQACSILKQASKWVKKKLWHDEMTITFKGVDSLGGDLPTVLFADVEVGSEVERLYDLHEYIKKKFSEEIGINMEPSQQFYPHMTIAKIAGQKELAKKKIDTFHPCLLEGLEDKKFGVQKVRKIQLLEMGSEDPVTRQFISWGDFPF